MQIRVARPIPSARFDTAENIGRRRDAFRALRFLCGMPKKQAVQDLKQWRTKVQMEKVRIPTKGDIEHVAKVTNRQQWESVPDDWTCPGCGRTKSEIVRPSNNMTWSFPFRSKYFRDLNNQWRRSTQSACDDCGHAGTNLAKEAAELAGFPVEKANAQLVELVEIARIVIAKPHDRHHFDNQEASILVKEIAARLSDEMSIP
jgi:rubredoxin